jgi:hypothetical protein
MKSGERWEKVGKTRLETSRGDAGGGPDSPEPADIEGASSRSHGPAAERSELGLGEQESTHCLNRDVTCVECQNGKSISPTDSAQPTMAHDADTDSDRARRPDGKHPSAWNATPAMLLGVRPPWSDGWELLGRLRD